LFDTQQHQFVVVLAVGISAGREGKVVVIAADDVRGIRDIDILGSEEQELQGSVGQGLASTHDEHVTGELENHPRTLGLTLVKPIDKRYTKYKSIGTNPHRRTIMASPKSYPSTPVGELLGRFYNHRSVLRRTIPLFAIAPNDVVKALRGEAAMKPGQSTPATPGGRPHQRAGAPHNNRRPAHAPS